MSTVTCPDCWGEGNVEVPCSPMLAEDDTEFLACPTCGTEGEVPVAECPDCRGEGEVDYVVDLWSDHSPSHRTKTRTGPCLACDGVGVQMDLPGPCFVPLPPQLEEEWERTATENPDATPMEVAR